MQQTLAFAPTQDDFDDALFDVPLITMTQPPVDDEESEQGEP